MKMNKSFILFFIVVIFSSCSSLKHTPKTPQIVIDQQQLDSVIELSVSELIKGDWLSDYLMENNERPILVASKIHNESNAYIDTLKVYETINMALIRSGQVRVVKLDEKQRQQIPNEITKGESVDFAISTKIENKISESLSSLFFGLYLLNDKSPEPIVKIIKKIE